MSRTYKKYTAACYRCPKGKRRALIGNARAGAIPPDSWDDISIDKQCWLPMRVAVGLAKNGFSFLEIVKHVQDKFGLLLRDAEWMAEWADDDRPKVQEGRLAVYDEKVVRD